MSKLQTKAEFEHSRGERIAAGYTQEAHRLAHNLEVESVRAKYFYNFTWMGLPIIQFPQDLVRLQELIWQNRPDVIIETGLAWGGSAAFYASCLNNLGMPDDRMSPRRVFSIEQKVMDGVEKDLDDRLVELLYVESVRIESSSLEASTARMVDTITRGKKVMVCLDSKHTADHVRAELALWAPMVTPGQSLVVFDTFVERMPAALYENHECGPGDSPMTAVMEFVREHPDFEADLESNKLLISSNHGGWLRKIK